MLKKLLTVSTVLGVAALLQNKERRDRLVAFARELLTDAREKVDQIGTQEPPERSSVRSELASGAGATTRNLAVPPPLPPPPRSGSY